MVRAYPVTADGAGYKASIVNILDGNKKNNWFRPADVCTAPDGSIFVADWYDPGVGGHAQGDRDRGRIFRVAPPGVKYNVPKTKFDTIEDNIEALKNPNLATRYIAWTNLHKAGAKAEPALLKLYASKVPHERAALWLLGRIEGKGRNYFEKGHQTATQTFASSDTSRPTINQTPFTTGSRCRLRMTQNWASASAYALRNQRDLT